MSMEEEEPLIEMDEEVTRRHLISNINSLDLQMIFPGCSTMNALERQYSHIENISTIGRSIR